MKMQVSRNAKNYWTLAGSAWKTCEVLRACRGGNGSPKKKYFYKSATKPSDNHQRTFFKHNHLPLSMNRILTCASDYCTAPCTATNAEIT